jgi:hypothetical protein
LFCNSLARRVGVDDSAEVRAVRISIDRVGPEKLRVIEDVEGLDA